MARPTVGWGVQTGNNGAGCQGPWCPLGPHLSLRHRGEAHVRVGDEGVLHCVHGETVEGDLGAHVILEAFDHRTIESGPDRGLSACLWLHGAAC